MSAESVNGAFTAKNYIGVQGVFARQTSDGTDYMLKNGHGDVTKLVRNGAVVQNYDFDAFGNQKTETTNDTNPFRYAGEYFDEESGLIYLRNRYYNPETQRFITEDPIQDGLNWYAYCGNNPINFVDPTGLVVTTWDEANLSDADLKQIKENDKQWKNGNAEQKKAAAKSSQNIRKKYLRDGQKLLDNGYVEETLTSRIQFSTAYTGTKIVMTNQIKRIYKEHHTYVSFESVKIEISTDSGFAITAMSVTNGQTGISSVKRIETFTEPSNSYNFTPNWGYVIDDNGVYTIIGTSLTVTVSRPNGKAYSTTVFNQLYNKMVIDEDGRIIYHADGFDILHEALMRGER